MKLYELPSSMRVLYNILKNVLVWQFWKCLKSTPKVIPYFLLILGMYSFRSNVDENEIECLRGFKFAMKLSEWILEGVDLMLARIAGAQSPVQFQKKISRCKLQNLPILFLPREALNFRLFPKEFHVDYGHEESPSV